MQITAIETLRTEELSNVLWVRVLTDAGITGIGETFYGAGAVEAHIHDTLIQESVRAFYTGWYKELVTVMPMEGPGLGTELLPAVYERSKRLCLIA